MVSSNVSGVVGGVATDRGFVTEETIVTASADMRDMEYPMPSFWGSVVAGALLALGLGALSICLMFGCHVGTDMNGDLSFGAGAAVWMIVTVCIAYFFGGLLASGLSLRGGWLRGVTMWGLSIPLALLILAFTSGSAGLAYAHMTHLTEQFANSTGAASLSNGHMFVNYYAAWVAFISLACGLISAVIGSSKSCGCAVRNKQISENIK
jgi:hypothetical protein